jgi:hypothetical protein
MANRAAKFVSALFVTVLAGLPLTAVSQSAPSTEEDCLSAPKGAAPQGQHWYYRLERGTKRQCWYLREEGSRAAQEGTRAMQSTQPAANAQNAASSAPRSVQDARAELTTPPAAIRDAAVSSPTQSPAVAPAGSQRPDLVADSSVPQSSPTTRWADASGATSPPAPQAAPDAPEADAQPAPNASPSPPAAPMTPAIAEAPAIRPTGSLPTLMLVVGGALSLAGIIGSVIYRFAGSRVRVQRNPMRAQANDGARRRVNWDNREWDNGEPSAENSRAPWTETPRGFAPRTRRPRLVDSAFALTEADRPAAPAPADIASIDTRARDSEPLATQLDDAAMEPEDEAIESYVEADAQVDDYVEDHDEATEAATETDADEIDIDAITEILERLAKEGPRLSPIAATGSADFSQSRQGRSGVRA